MKKLNYAKKKCAQTLLLYSSNLSEVYFKRQWTLIKTRAPTSMQKTCLFTLTQLFLERYGDNYYMDLALWFLDCVDNYTSVSLC